MKHVLVPIGHKENAVSTLQYAIDFASQINAKLFLVNVYSKIKVSGAFQKFDQLLVEDSAKVLQDHLKAVDQKQVEISLHVLKGHDITHSIKQLIKLLDINLIITSTKNDNSDDTVFLGGITGSLIKDTQTPVLVVPPKTSFKAPSKVLLTIKSGKIISNDKLEPLSKIKEAFNSTINLLQVKTPQMSNDELAISDAIKTITSDVLLTKNATVFQGVLELLRVENPDLLCVIRRKRGFFKKLWEQNKVKKIDFESNIPLLVLKGDS